jgi:hypothetical protein
VGTSKQMGHPPYSIFTKALDLIGCSVQNTACVSRSVFIYMESAVIQTGGGVRREVELALRPLSQKTKVFCPSGRIRSPPLICLRLARHTPPRMLAHHSRSGPSYGQLTMSATTPAYPYRGIVLYLSPKTRKICKLAPIPLLTYEQIRIPS